MSWLGSSRRAGWVVGIVGPIVLTPIVFLLRSRLDLSSILLLFLLVVAGAGALGTARSAVFTAVVTFTVINFLFTPPYYTLTIAEPEHVFALLVYLVVGISVSWLVRVISRLQSEADAAQRLTAVDELRTALLAAVSHDLRTPLAGIKASVTSLLGTDVDWEPETAREFLRSIDSETDKLNSLVGNLLDMSRLQTGVLSVQAVPVGADEIVATAMAGMHERTRAVRVDVPETLPRVLVDPGLAERAIANVVENAIKYSPRGESVSVTASASNGRLALRVVDHGRGIPAHERSSAFKPFQRLHDHPGGTGVGLGLAVARGFLEAMGGRLELRDTVGGGLTVVMDLPAETAGPDAPGQRPVAS